MMTDIYTEFASKGIRYRDMLLLSPAVALEFIGECELRKIKLLGYDAFRMLPGSRIQPIIEDSLDLSAEQYADCTPSEGLALAKHLIHERLQRNILFEMITD